MKRTIKQKNNIKNGCANRDNLLIVNAQKKRHLRNAINKKIIKAITNEKNFENCKNWVEKLEKINSAISLDLLLKEIEKELDDSTC